MSDNRGSNSIDSQLSVSEATPVEEENEHTIYSKARFERCLRDRWRCKVKGHSYCFKDGESAHIQLMEDHLKQWANICHNGYATILAPPENIISSSSRHPDSETGSIRSSSSRNTITYQRPFHFQLNPSLTDIRSWRSSLSSDGASSLSSGIPGPGYLSGKAIKWIGEKILDAATPLVIRRRLWAIERLIKYMMDAPIDDLPNLFLKQEKSLHRLVDDLLELYSGNYNVKYQNISRKLGHDFLDCLSRSRQSDTYMLRNGALRATSRFLTVKIAPLGFCNDDHNSVTSPSLSVALCDILLQESFPHGEIDCTISELVACACNELGRGVTSTSRGDAFLFFFCLYQMPAGRKELSKLGQSGGLLEHVAKETFKEGMDYTEQARAVWFFAHFAEDHPEYRHHVLGPNGLSLTISRLREYIPVGEQSSILPTNLGMIQLLCTSLHSATKFIWAVPTLLVLDSCNVLCQLLVFHHQLGRQDELIDYLVILALRNLSVVGGDPGRRAVREKLTSDNANVLERLNKEPWKRDWMAMETRQYISDILEE